MDEQDLIAACEAQGATHRQVDGRLLIDAPESLNLRSLTELPDRVSLNAEGLLYLDRLTKLGLGVSITAGLTINLDRLSELALGVTLTAGHSIYLGAVTKLAPSVSITAGRTIYLDSLSEVAAGVTLTAGGPIYALSLTGEQVINGHRCTLGHVDGISYRELSQEHAVGDGVTVQRVALLRGAWDDHPIRYLARQGTYAAHEVTPQDALRDLADKVRAANFDLEAWAAEAVAADRVTRQDYRLATKACGRGVDEWLAGRLDAHVDAVTVDQAIELCRGGYGEARFIDAVERARRKRSGTCN